MEWTNKQRHQHREAAAILERIKDETFLAVGEALVAGKSITEYDVCQNAIARCQEYGLLLGDTPPIVAFGPSAAQPHYDPFKDGTRMITRGNVLLLDIWGKLDDPGAPWADITWMAWTGGAVPDDVQAAFDAVLVARDAGVRFLEKNMHEGLAAKDVDDVVRGSLRSRGLDAFFAHGTGHHLSAEHVHGGAYTFKKDETRAVVPLTGATIEPGVYVPEGFGIRSECDIFLLKKGIEITTPMQEDWVRLG